MEPVINFFERLVTDFSWKRLLLVIVLIGILIGGFYTYKNETSNFKLTKYERTIIILEKINKLQNEDNKTQQIIKNILNGLEDITKETKINIQQTEIKKQLMTILKWSFLWIILSVLFFIQYIRTKEDLKALLGSLVFTIPIMSISNFIPEQYNTISNSLIANGILIVVLAAIGMRK